MSQPDEFPAQSKQKCRMRHRHQRVAADNELKRKKTRAAKFAKKVSRLAHMHKPGLHPAFVCWFAASRGRSLAYSLCWYISGL